MNGAEAADVLDRLGSHRSTAERAALRAILRMGPRCIPALRRAAQSHPNAHARSVALSALAELAGAGAARTLLAALDDPAMPVRQRALVALDRFAWPLAAPERVARALDDDSPGVRHVAAVILGRRGVRRATGRLIARLNDPSWHVRQQAAASLGELRARSALAALRRAAGDERRAVRLAAGAALERIDGRRPL
jgi:HEAT repeat protein